MFGASRRPNWGHVPLVAAQLRQRGGEMQSRKEGAERGEEMVDAGGVLAVKVGVQLLTRVAPTGLAWVSTWYKGKRIAIVGQPGAGKTSFLRYMQYGVLADPELPRQPTEDEKKSAAFSIKSGRDNMLELQVRSILDTVGQVNARDHARTIAKYKPHALVIVLDLDTTWDGKNNHAASFYLSEFCGHLAMEMHPRSNLARNVSNTTLVLNKVDQVEPSRAARWEKDSRRILNSQLTKFGPDIKKIPIMRCTLLEGGDISLAEKIVRHVALSLQ